MDFFLFIKKQKNLMNKSYDFLEKKVDTYEQHHVLILEFSN